MGNIGNAYMNKTPLIILWGNQTREMLVGDVCEPTRWRFSLRPAPYFCRFRWTTGTSLRWAAVNGFDEVASEPLDTSALTSVGVHKLRDVPARGLPGYPLFTFLQTR
jgi:hypothetical protein